VLAALKATAGRPAQTQTPAGKINVTLYEISFSIYQVGSGAMLSRQDWEVHSLAEDLPDLDVLFGLDLIRQIVLTVDGPGGTFSLDF
jgi:hypothetical protein